MAQKVKLRDLTQRIDTLERSLGLLAGGMRKMAEVVGTLYKDRAKLREEFGECLDLLQTLTGEENYDREEDEVAEGDSIDGLEAAVLYPEDGEGETPGRLGRSTTFDSDGHPVTPTGGEEG